MHANRRPIRIQRTAGGTIMWFLSSRTSVTVIVLLVLLTVGTLLALTRPWERFTEPQREVVFVPVPVQGPIEGPPQDTDGDGVADVDELAYGTDPAPFPMCPARAVVDPVTLAEETTRRSSGTTSVALASPKSGWTA